MTQGQPPEDHPAPPVRVVAFELTRTCNLRCPYCRAQDYAPDQCESASSHGAGTRLSPAEMPTSGVFHVLDEIAGLGRPLVILSGGEPLLRDDLIPIVERSVATGLPTALATNGTLLTAATARALRDAGVRRVSVSMDSPDRKRHDAVRGKGAFVAAGQGLSHLREAGLPFQINMTVRRENAGEVEELLAFAQSEGAVAFHVFFVVDVGRAAGGGQGLEPAKYEGTLREIASLERDSSLEIRVTCAPQYSRIKRTMGIETGPPRRHCMAGAGFLFISATGEVKPCGYFDMVAGVVTDKPLAEIWRNAPLFRALRAPEGLKGRCGACHFSSVCGGCRARALAATGDFLSEDPACVYNPKE